MKIRKREKKKKENSTELQKSNIEAEVYNSNENCDWKKKKNMESLSRFHSANKVDSYNRVHQKGKDKIPKNLHNKSKHKHDKFFPWATAIRFLSLAGSHSPPYFPMKLSKTVLISGPAVGAAQILIWSYSCVFLPPVFRAIRARVCSLVGALNDLLDIL